jgi:hypothetical protein
MLRLSLSYYAFGFLCGFAETNLLDIYSQVIETAENIDDAVRELPDANLVRSHLEHIC